jgi:exonuclease VII small subunit
MSGSKIENDNDNLDQEIKSYNDSIAVYNAAKLVLNEKQNLFLMAIATGGAMDEKAVEAAQSALLDACKGFNPAKEAVKSLEAFRRTPGLSCCRVRECRVR